MGRCVDSQSMFATWVLLDKLMRKEECIPESWLCRTSFDIQIADVVEIQEIANYLHDDRRYGHCECDQIYLTDHPP